MTYKYENPCEKGFIHIPVTRRQHNKMLPHHRLRFGVKAEYYWLPENNILEVQGFHTWWAKAFLILVMFLPAVLMNGLPETCRDIMDLIYERSRGKFFAERWFLNHQKTTDGKLEALMKEVYEAKEKK